MRRERLRSWAGRGAACCSRFPPPTAWATTARESAVGGEGSPPARAMSPIGAPTFPQPEPAWSRPPLTRSELSLRSRSRSNNRARGRRRFRARAATPATERRLRAERRSRSTRYRPRTRTSQPPPPVPPRMG